MKNYQVLLMIIIHCANISMWKSHNDAHRIWSKFHFIQQKAFSSSINRWSLNLRYTIKTFYRASFNGTFPSSDWWAIVSSYLPPIELIFFLPEWVHLKSIILWMFEHTKMGIFLLSPSSVYLHEIQWKVFALKWIPLMRNLAHRTWMSDGSSVYCQLVIWIETSDK